LSVLTDPAGALRRALDYAVPSERIVAAVRELLQFGGQLIPLPYRRNPMQPKLKASILGLSLFLASPAALAGAAEEVQVLDPYVRAMPPGQSVSAAFLGLSNTGKEDHALVAAETSVAMMVELHEHTMAEGMMQMRKVEKIDLPAGATVELKPGGLHIMLINLKSQLKPGDEVEIILIYRDGSKATVQAPVRKIGAMMR
jgi:copper(I)-binding protein